MNPVPPKSPCPCGQPLPWHLFNLGLGLSHICLCDRKYVQKRDTLEVLLVGTEPNPLARVSPIG